jgi:hypothetical protein
LIAVIVEIEKIKIKMNDTIFIQIASYRDTELPKTIKSALEKAKFPERIYFGIYNQFDEQTENSLDEFADINRIKFEKIPWREARGLGIARNVAEGFYDGQTYTLQTDSHMRFVDDWDEKLIDEWKKCEYEKAVLTGYPPLFKYENGVEIFSNDLKPAMLVVRTYHEGWLPVFEGKMLTHPISKPQRVAFAAGGFMFAPGNMSREVRHIKEVTFPEEMAYSIRLFSYGYRMYAPTYWAMFHLYERAQFGGHYYWKNFSDDPDLSRNQVYKEIKQKSDGIKRKILFDGDQSYLGHNGTLEEFENYCGIKIKDKIIHPFLMETRETPYATDSSWVDEYAAVQEVPVEVSIDTSAYNMNIDYDFWLFALRDNQDVELVRDDIKLENWNTPKIEIKKKYMLRAEPVKYVIWPHSRSKGWLERREFEYKN